MCHMGHSTHGHVDLPPRPPESEDNKMYCLLLSLTWGCWAKYVISWAELSPSIKWKWYLLMGVAVLNGITDKVSSTRGWCCVYVHGRMCTCMYVHVLLLPSFWFTGEPHIPQLTYWSLINHSTMLGGSELQRCLESRQESRKDKCPEN